MSTHQTWTFLFSDIEGSTKLLQRLGDRYPQTLDDHRRLIGAAVEEKDGRVFGSEGDALFCAFPNAGGAITAAAAAQRNLAGHAWPDDGEVRVRMGVHSGEALSTGDDFVGLPLHQVARIMAAAHGGQVLVSEATRRLLSTLPAGLELRDLGERRLKDLALPERLYQLVGEGLADRFPPLRTLDSKPNNLPIQVTSFVGRAELAKAQAVLAGARLLTLSGPGGTGKTRLALQLAGEASDDFPDGVFFVALDSVRDAGLVASVIASTIGLNVSGSVAPLDAVIEYLREKHVLLVLDNFEQVVDAANDVARLLRELPDLKMIVTTRIPLRVYGEQEFPVGPLGLPDTSDARLTAQEATQYEAVRLFVERAMAVQPAFVLSDETAPLVVDIVRRLDGLPLAIELAAARTRVLPVAAIHARLDQHLNLLTGGSRDLPGRQQTLRGAIDWSYDLLEDSDRRLFTRFSVHAGGAFLTQADAVCGPAAELGEDVLDGLSSLSDKSLVRANLSADEDPRFAMLATIRDYAHERLASSPEDDEIARRHAQTYLALVESVSGQLLGMDARRITDRLELDNDNLRQALDWAVGQADLTYALRFVVAVWRFWQVRGHLDEARRRVDAVLALPGIEEQPADLLARAYIAAGGVAYWQGDAMGTYDLYGKALAAAQRSGDRRLIAEATYNVGFAPFPQAQPSDSLFAAGRPLFEESLRLYRELGDDVGVADASWALSISLGAGGADPVKTIEVAEDALQTYRKLNDPFRTGWGSFIVGSMRLRQEQVPSVTPYFDEALRIFARSRDQTGIQMLLVAYSLLATRQGQHDRAYTLAGAVEKLKLATGSGITDAPVDFLAFTPLERPDDPDLLRAWEAGGRMSTEEAIDYALSEQTDGSSTKPEMSAS